MGSNKIHIYLLQALLLIIRMNKALLNQTMLTGHYVKLHNFSYSFIRLVRSPGEKGNIKQRKERDRKTRKKKNRRQRNGKTTKEGKETKKTKLNQKLNANRKMKGKKSKKRRRKLNQGLKRKGKKAIARQTCSATTPVASTCMENAKNVLVYEETQVTNYLKQSKQLIRHGAQADSKR